MTRLDVRVKTQLPAKLLHPKDVINIEESTIISELSLSGALIEGLFHKAKDVIKIKPKLPECNDIDFMGEVIRRFNGRMVVRFYYFDRYIKTKLWEYIKKRISNKEVCPYCSYKNNAETEYCLNCNWLLNFNDTDYLDKHDRETFGIRVTKRVNSLGLKQMQGVIKLIDVELLKEKGIFLHEECLYTFKYMHDVLSTIGKVGIRDKNNLYALEEEIRKRYCFDFIVSCHPQMVEILKLISQVADTEATVLIQGESGTGKELVARALHYNSRRKDKAFVPINCGALPENLLESELFGHVQGAFTGAIKDEAGWFERSEGGTILLDEVSEMTPALQVKLLRILQTGEYSRVGSTEIHKCNVRVLASTNKKLQKLVKEGKFREDLYYRLNVLDIYLPPLRDRKCDIPILTKHFLKIFGSKYAKENLRLTQDVEALLIAYNFPGNIRELENIIQRAVVLAESETIEALHLPNGIQSMTGSFNDKEKPSVFKIGKRKAIEEFEIEYVNNCLKVSRGNISRAARSAGMNIKNFRTKIKKYGIDPHSFKFSIE